MLPAMPDDLTQPPYHIFERRHFEDSEGRRIEFRQIVPGSFAHEPSPTEFIEFLGHTSVTVTIMGIPQGAPVRFPIVAKDLIAAFKMFDVEKAKAQTRAKEMAEARLREKQREMSSKIILADGSPVGDPSAFVPLVSGL